MFRPHIKFIKSVISNLSKEDVSFNFNFLYSFIQFIELLSNAIRVWIPISDSIIIIWIFLNNFNTISNNINNSFPFWLNRTIGKLTKITIHLIHSNIFFPFPNHKNETGKLIAVASSTQKAIYNNHTFKSDIIFRKSVNEPYVSKSSNRRLCGTKCFGRGKANGTGNNSGITEWCVISAFNDENSFVKPCNGK